MPDSQTNVKVEAGGGADATEFRVMLARFETKLDLVLGQHDHRLNDHESRVRSLEERKTVSPAQLLATSASVVALMGGTFTVLDRLFAK